MSDILSDSELLRYNRQIILRGFDFEGQEALKQAAIIVVGLGGLGCSASQYLAAAGIGKMTLIDFDTVSLSNLQRQVLHHDNRIGQAKVESAAQSLQLINPHLTIEVINQAVDNLQFNQLLTNHQLVLDCTDNVTVRNQLNQLCYQAKIPLISGAAIRMEGYVTTFTYAADQPCYHCLSQLFSSDSLTCVEAGVMSPLVAMIGSVQAMEAIKLLAHFGETLAGRLLLVDAMTMQFRQFNFSRNPHCTICGSH